MPMMLQAVGSLLLCSMQDEETLRSVRNVVLNYFSFMPCGVGAAGQDPRFARFGLDGARAKCDLVPTIIDIAESKDIQWALKDGKLDEAEVRKTLGLGANYLLEEYTREFKDKRVEEYFRRVAFDHTRHIHVRKSAASSAGRMFTPSWPAFAADALRKHRDVAGAILQSLSAIHLYVEAARYREFYTEDVAKALREYIAATPANYADSEGAKWVRAIAADLEAGRVPRPSFEGEKKPADAPKTNREAPEK